MTKAIDFSGGRLRLLDQRLLPRQVVYRDYGTYEEVAEAISNMVVRGAPAIGIASAYGVYLAADASVKKHGEKAQLTRLMDEITRAGELLKRARPTAVNLSWAVDRVIAACWKAANARDVAKVALEEARRIEQEDMALNRRMGSLGNTLIPYSCNILTHCNAGALATGGYGTALGVIRAAKDSGKRIHVYVDETRPLLQGARLTAWELSQEGIPYTIITDNAAGYLMKLGKVDIVIVGADRIASNGDVANKIGTYSLAVLARAHGIPFYVAAPYSTVDFAISSGKEIVIEERDSSEVTSFAGTEVAPQGAHALNLAFDVTPAEYITAIITDKGIISRPCEANLREIFQNDGTQNNEVSDGAHHGEDGEGRCSC